MIKFHVTRTSFEGTDRKPDFSHSKLERIPDGMGNEIDAWVVEFKDMAQFVKFLYDEGGRLKIVHSNYPTCMAQIEIEDD